MSVCPADVALAKDAGPTQVASMLVARGFTTSEVLAVMRLATEKGEAMLGETEPLDVALPDPWDVQVASRWTAVNRFRDAYMRALALQDAEQQEDAEAEASRWETAAVRVAPAAAERVFLSAEVWMLRRAREVNQHW
ncbi:hypothetical protein [Spirillospora sp. CA-128828]|uniref:hypothetical protein n=1 Tax=Spirillospora sp. CA-128828 TaxID=3240033 RepID=UPI003D8E683D